MPDTLQHPASLLEKFTFQAESYGSGWRLTGVPRDAQGLFSRANFTRLILLLDEYKNITALTLYDRSDQPAIELQLVYAEISGLYLPERAEIFLVNSQLRVTTEYRQIKLNITLYPSIFAPEQVRRGSELEG